MEESGAHTAKNDSLPRPTSKPLDVSDIPLSATSRDLPLVRASVLAKIGWHSSDVVLWLEKSVAKLISQLEATKTTYHTHKGYVRDQSIDNDNAIQLAAARELLKLGLDFSGLGPTAEHSKSHQPPAVTIDLSGWTVEPPKGKQDDTSQ